MTGPRLITDQKSCATETGNRNHYLTLKRWHEVVHAAAKRIFMTTQQEQPCIRFHGDMDERLANDLRKLGLQFDEQTEMWTRMHNICAEPYTDASSLSHN